MKLTDTAGHKLKPCMDCGQRGTRGKRCNPCYLKAVTSQKGCADCGVKTSRYNAKRCADCFRKLARDRRTDQLVRSFRAEAFRKILEDDELEWTPELIANECNGLVSAATIYRWLQGVAKPTQAAFDIVSGVLALEPCPDCGGLGRRIVRPERKLRLLDRNYRDKERQKKAKAERMRRWRRERKENKASA